MDIPPPTPYTPRPHTHLTQGTTQVKVVPEVVEQLLALLHSQVAQLRLQLLRLRPVGEVEEAEQVALIAHPFPQVRQRLVGDGQVAQGGVVELQEKGGGIPPVPVQENLHMEMDFLPSAQNSHWSGGLCMTTKTDSGPVELFSLCWTSNFHEKCQVFSQPTPQW